MSRQLPRDLKVINYLNFGYLGVEYSREFVFFILDLARGSEHTTLDVNCRAIKSSTNAYKVYKRTQELIQSDPHQAPNAKGKDKQIQ